MRSGTLLTLIAATASAQTVEVTRVEAGNALSTVMQRHMVRVAPQGRSATLLLAVQRDALAAPDPEGLHWYRSDDEGRSWRYFAPIFEDGIAGEEVHLTADLLVVGEDVAAVYSYDTTQTDFPSDPEDRLRRVYFQWWRHDGAGGWRPGPRLILGDPASGFAYHRANLARDSLGRLWVQAWYREPCPTSAGRFCEDTVRLWVSTDGGTSFTPQPDLLTLPLLGGGRLISLGTRLMMLWGDYSWDNPARYALREDSDPLDQWGDPVVAFADRDSIYHGAAFNAVADGRGGLHLVFKDRREQLYYRYFDGTSFSSRTFVDGESFWAVQPAVTLHGDELYVCTNHYFSSSGTYELQSRRLSDGFSTRRVLESTRDRKFYPTAPERVPPEVGTIPCAFTAEQFPGRLKVSLQDASSSQGPGEPPDAGAPPDGGTAPDAGSPPDAGTGQPDAGLPPDAGTPPSGEQVTLGFQQEVSPPGYTGTRDTTLLSTDPSRNRGAVVEAEADGSPDSAFLISWDLSAIPPASTVLSARIVLEVLNATRGSYELYPLARRWEESGATWREALAGEPWQQEGARGTADRGRTPVGVLTAPSTGRRTVELNSEGVAMVQRWVAEPSQNLGIIVQDYTGSSDGVDVATREASVPSRRPRLEITYLQGESGPPLPEVSLTAPDSTLSELGLDPGRLRFARSGETEQPLVVRYLVSGTASPDEDYPALPGSVELPAGEAWVEVPVSPLDDTQVEGGETLVVTLLDDVAYALGSARSATLSLADDEAPPPTAATVTFQQGVSPSGYAGARDATIFSGSPSTNFGAGTSLSVDGSPDQGVLLGWEVSALPAGSVVEAAWITLRVHNPSLNTYLLREVRRPWTEGGVTWTRYDGANAWQVPGGFGADDRGEEVLAEVGAPATGEVTVALTAAGIALLQRWIDAPSSNLGMILQEGPAASDGLDFYSSEASSSTRPRLTIRYRPP